MDDAVHGLANLMRPCSHLFFFRMLIIVGVNPVEETVLVIQFGSQLFEEFLQNGAEDGAFVSPAAVRFDKCLAHFFIYENNL